MPFQTEQQNAEAHAAKTRMWNENYEVASRHAEENRVAQAKQEATKAETESLAAAGGEVYQRRQHARSAAEAAAKAFREAPAVGDNGPKFIAAVESMRDVADVVHRVTRFKADQDIALAVRQAGDNPVAREKARAAAMAKHADALGSAESDVEAARLEFDRTVVEVAKACKVYNARAEFVKGLQAERLAGEQDVMRATNPYADPIRPKIASWQFDAIRDPALKAKAAKEADIVDFADPPFTKAEVASILRMRGSARQVMTMSEFSRIADPAAKFKASQTALLVDDDE